MNNYKYLMAYTIPLSAVLAISSRGVFSYTTVLYAFGLIPILEVIIKTHNQSFSEEEVSNRLQNKLFDWLLYLNLPWVYGLLFAGLSVMTRENLSGFELIGLILSLGIVLGSNGINVAHELGHRKTKIEQFLAKTLLLPALYSHFFIEHNHGHHKNVATKEDPATAQKGESVYFFWIRSVSGQYINAWKIQKKLLTNQKASFFSIKNNMFYALLLQGVYLTSVFFLFGFNGLCYALGIAVVSFLLLETINYIEHYGILKKKINGRYERVRNIHSWNSDHLIGRIVLYELTRHSDHHYIASKKYQILESKSESPRLPFGYPTSMLIALLPPLWYVLMHSRLERLQN